VCKIQDVRARYVCDDLLLHEFSKNRLILVFFAKLILTKQQAKTALSNENFKELARKMEPNIEETFPQVCMNLCVCVCVCVRGFA